MLSRLEPSGGQRALPRAAGGVRGRALGVIASLAPAVVAAALYTLACPPYDWSLLAWAVPALLLVPAGRMSPGRALASGTLFGVVIGAGITYWALPASVEYFEIGRTAAVAFVICVWLVASGIPYGLLALAYAVLARRAAPAARPLLGAWLWVGCELLRANPWTGMPWELLSHTQWRNLTLLQVADLGGMYAVSFVVALVSLTAGELLAERRARPLSRGLVVRRVALPATLLVAVLLYGMHSEAVLARELVDAPGARVAVVQSSVPTEYRWKRAFVERVLTTYAGLTRDAVAASGSADLVVWPENAVGFYLDGEPLLRTQIGGVAAKAGGELLIGAPRLGGTGTAHNSAYVIDGEGEIRGSYDKRKLVPFAEYDPLPGRAEASSADLAYAGGRAPGVLEAAGLKLGAVICYEAIFPSLVRDTVRRGADVLVNLSNDSWLDAGTSGIAAQQHLSMTVFRAIEQRRFLIRAASSGISGFVTPYGETVGLVPVGASASSVARITPRTARTVYAVWGETWVALLGVGVLASLRRGKRATSEAAP